MTRTITIYNRRGPRDVEADVKGPFAIHASIAPSDTWTLTHSPTGYALLITGSKLRCVHARAELLAAGGNWKSTDAAVIAKRHRVIGRAVREKYGHIR